MSSAAAQLITAVAYLVAAVLWWNYFRVGRNRKRCAAGPAARQAGGFSSHNAWAGCLCLIVAAADRYYWLSHRFADAVRCLAHEQGWYTERRGLQSALALGVALCVSAL